MLSAREIVTAVLSEHYKALRLPGPSRTVKLNLGNNCAEQAVSALLSEPKPEEMAKWANRAAGLGEDLA